MTVGQIMKASRRSFNSQPYSDARSIAWTAWLAWEDRATGRITDALRAVGSSLEEMDQ